MKVTKKTRKTASKTSAFEAEQEIPGLLVARGMPGSVSVDRCAIKTPFTVGRSSDCDFAIDDEKVSGAHFRICRDANGYWAEDLGSTNGTFVNGDRLPGPRLLGHAFRSRPA